MKVGQFVVHKKMGHGCSWCLYQFFCGSLIRAHTGSFANVSAGTSPLYIKVGQILGLSENGSWVLVDARRFLHGLSLHLNPPYRIEIGNFFLAIWDTSHWNFLSNLDSRQLETCLMTSYVTFEICQLLRRLQGHLSILAKIGCLQKIKVFSMKERTGLQCNLGVLGSQITRLYDGTIFGGGCNGLKRVLWAVKKQTEKLHFQQHLRRLKGYSALTYFIKNQSIGVGRVV